MACGRYIRANFISSFFLAPTGPQGVTLSVRFSGTKLSRALILLISGSYIQADFMKASGQLQDDIT